MLTKVETEWVSVPVKGAPVMSAYVARPSGVAKPPAVIVGMELFGVTAHIREIARRLAEQGYLALAPDFYHRDETRAELGYDDAGRARGFELLGQLSRARALADVEASLAYLEGALGREPRAAFVGFSVGGHISYLAATQFPLAACVAFYPGWLTNSGIALSQPTPTLELTSGIPRECPVTLFVGGEDQLIPQEQRAEIRGALEAAGTEHELVVYPGVGHGFFCDERASYDRAAHDDAWQRVLELLARCLTIH